MNLSPNHKVPLFTVSAIKAGSLRPAFPNIYLPNPFASLKFNQPGFILEALTFKWDSLPEMCVRVLDVRRRFRGSLCIKAQPGSALAADFSTHRASHGLVTSKLSLEALACVQDGPRQMTKTAALQENPTEHQGYLFKREEEKYS